MTKYESVLHDLQGDELTGEQLRGWTWTFEDDGRPMEVLNITQGVATAYFRLLSDQPDERGRFHYRAFSQE